MRLRDRQRRRPARRHAFRPGGEGLEPRLALSGAPIGVNLDANTSYADSPIWTDVRNIAYAWWPMGQNWPGTSSVPLTADGYPLASAQTMFQMTNYPDGTYGFSYTGTATITVDGIGQLNAVTTANGVTTGTITVNHSWADGTYLHIHILNPSTTSPMDNFHLMLPGYGNGTAAEPMFTPAFIQALAPFSDIRFMNWGETNDSTLSAWSNRVGPTAFLTDGNGGVPYEDMIELCNEAQKDMWINIPALATPQFVQSLAQLIDTELDPNLNVYVEYGNEDWNSAFSAYGQIYTLAQANPVLNQSLGEYQLVSQQTAYTLVNDGQIFDQVFGTAQASRVRPILGGQAAWTQFQTYELQFIQQQFGSPSQYIDSLAVAPYIAINSNQNVSGLTINQLFTDLNQYYTSQVIPWITSNVALAKQYGVPLMAYEGGQGLVPGTNGLNEAVMQQAQNDPRMYQLYVAMMQEWQQAGGGLFDAYQLTGTGGNYGFWGMLPDVTVTGSQKYDAMIASAFLPGDANTDGAVNVADFQTIAANYGMTGAWWVNGDFNDDGTVNAADLNLMRQNLSPSGFTLSQFAQQALFGQAASLYSDNPLEFDGYGVTYAGGMTLSSTTGTVVANETSTGHQITLGGTLYSQGLGFGGNSSTTIALNGQYTRFDSTIGVDGNNSTASSVIFQVYGDGSLLYQSSTLANGSAAVPIDVNVAGVTKLTLVVEAAPGSSASGDHAVWADARLVSTANIGSTQPYSLTWQLSQNGQVISTQTADSLLLTGLLGTYTLGLTVADGNGNQGTASTTFTVLADNTTGTYLLKDSTTQGNWIANYGNQGYEIESDGTKLPSYASVSVSNASTYTCTSSTTDVRALQNPGGSGRAATTWYSPTSFTIDVNLTDGQTHHLALYAVDWEKLGRSEQIQLIDANSGAVLDTESLTSFTGGVYLQWAISGNVDIVVTNEGGTAGGNNAVISGVFLDSAVSRTTPTLTWASPASIVYGTALTSAQLDATASVPGTFSYSPAAGTVPGAGTDTLSVTFTPTDTTDYTTATATTTIVVSQATPGVVWTTPASIVYGTALSSTQLDATASVPGTFSYSPAAGKVLGAGTDTLSVTFTPTDSSDYKSVTTTTTIVVTQATPTITWANPANIVTGTALSATQLDATANVPGTFTYSPAAGTVLGVGNNQKLSVSFVPTDSTDYKGASASAFINVVASAGATASFLKQDSKTQGTWMGTYGGQGYDVIDGSSSLPSYATITPSGQSNYVWTASTTDVRALQTSGGSTRIAATWFSLTSFSVAVNLTDGQVHDLELYFLDWDKMGRSEQVQITSASTGAVLSTQSISSFQSGLYLNYAVSGSIVITFKDLGPGNAVLSGLFLDQPATTASFVKKDTTTQGNWIGAYGSKGYDIEGDSPSLPTYASVGFSGASTYTWASSTSDVRALQNPGGSGRAATTWFSLTNFTINVNLTDGLVHDLSLYALDWDKLGRSEQIQIINASTGTVLDTESISSFSGGDYLEWAVSGNIQVKVTNMGGKNAVIGGLFLD
jgi:hypothetical protein